MWGRWMRRSEYTCGGPLRCTDRITCLGTHLQQGHLVPGEASSWKTPGALASDVNGRLHIDLGNMKEGTLGSVLEGLGIWDSIP